MNNSSGLFVVCLIICVCMMIFFKPNENINNQPNNQNPIIVNPNPIQPPVIVNPPIIQQPPVIVAPDNIEAKRLYQLGYEDGIKNRPKNSQFSNSAHYEAGYRDGFRACQPQLRFNINIK